VEERLARQSPVTDPGIHHAAVADAVRAATPPEVVHGLVIHLGLGRYYDWKVPRDRMPEAELRGVEALLSRALELDPSPLHVARPPERRLVGHCRVAAVVACSLYRAAGVPCAARAGFRAYHRKRVAAETWDHWICEVLADGRGRYVDPELDDVLQRVTGDDVDPLDIPRDAFVTAGEAWLAVRSGEARGEQFGLDPSDAGADYVRAMLLRDLAALNGWEAAGSDTWGLAGVSAESLGEDDLTLFDSVAEATAVGAAGVERARELYASDPRLRPTLA
jgi:hypothetical protein